MTDFEKSGTKGDSLDFSREKYFWVRGSMPNKNRSMLSGHLCRMPHLTGIGAERVPLRLSVARDWREIFGSSLYE